MRADEENVPNHEAGPEVLDAEDQDDLLEADELYDDAEPGIDWVVFLIRISGFVVIGAMLATSIDLSTNQGAEWLTVMRLAVVPFVGGVLLLAAAELIDRSGD